MSITTSIIVFDLAQADGRRWITERHTDGNGLNYLRNYLADAPTDRNAALAAYAVTLESDLEAREIASNLQDVATRGSLAAPTFLFTTAAQNVAALRAVFLLATNFQSVMIGDFLSTLSNGQLQTAFGLTAGQVTTLRTNKLTPAANIAASMRSSSGA